MGSDVTVKIKLLKPVGNLDNDYPLILVAQGATITDIAYTECRSLDEIETLGYSGTTKAYNVAKMIFSQDDAPNKIAIKNCATDDELDTLKDVIDMGWRQLILIIEGDTPDTTLIKSISDYIETTDKLYLCSVKTIAEVASLTTSNTRTAVFVYNDTEIDYPEAALSGATVGLPAGSITYKNIILKGLKSQDDLDIDAVHTAKAFTCVNKAGDLVTTEGKVLSGEFIDIIDSKDYVVKRISYNTQKVLNTSRKVPYDNTGIAMLEAATLEALKDAYNNGIIASDDDGKPAYTVNFALRSQTTETDRYNRNYPYGRFTFVLAGAIHFVEVNGEITV